MNLLNRNVENRLLKIRGQFMKITVFYGLLIALLIFSFISCGDDNVNGNFISSTNDTTLNNISTLGLVGTSAFSNNTNVATVEMPLTDKIKITSVSEGTAIITVSDGTNNATINVSVSKTGSIIIGTITKYEENNQNIFIGTWSGTVTTAGPDYGKSVTIKFSEDLTWNFIIIGSYQLKGTYTQENNSGILNFSQRSNDGVTWTDDFSGFPVTHNTATITGNTMTIVAPGLEGSTIVTKQNVVNDPFDGTWIGTIYDTTIKIVAANGSFKQYNDNVEGVRGIYTFLGNTVTWTAVEVNPGVIFGSFGGIDGWVNFSSLSSEFKEYMGGNDTAQITIIGNTFTNLIPQEITYTKQ